MAKKKTSKKSGQRKKTTRKKTSTSSKTSRASSAKKTSARKKSSTSKKKTTRKTTKKSPARKTSARKTSASKKKPAKKTTAKTSKKKAPASKKKTAKTAKSAKTSKKSKTTKKTSKSKKTATKGEPGRSDASVAAPTITLTDARAAASRLAAAAGLPSLRQRTPEVEQEAIAEKKLTKSPLTKRELNKFREILELKRSEVAGDVTDMESEALGQGKGELSSLPQHMADQGSDEYDQSLSLGLAQSQRVLLKEIDAAILRIENRTYGVCEALGVPIPKERLNATPWARYSVEGARMVDRGVKPS